jgi:hypothetical protein
MNNFFFTRVIQSAAILIGANEKVSQIFLSVDFEILFVGKMKQEDKVERHRNLREILIPNLKTENSFLPALTKQSAFVNNC